MTPAHDALRQEILVLQPVLYDCARRLAAETRPWLFGLMRSAYHSVDRRKARRRDRSDAVRVNVGLADLLTPQGAL
ncbi:MAG TPA: hypothetical protein VG939_07070 [Caulobacteraceae bacterium]|nr:hypothetical protein [Caulobacteraceae bacterium]